MGETGSEKPTRQGLSRRDVLKAAGAGVIATAVVTGADFLADKLSTARQTQEQKKPEGSPLDLEKSPALKFLREEVGKQLNSPDALTYEYPTGVNTGSERLTILESQDYSILFEDVRTGSFGFNRFSMPLDNADNVRIAWIDRKNKTAGEVIYYHSKTTPVIAVKSESIEDNEIRDWERGAATEFFSGGASTSFLAETEVAHIIDVVKNGKVDAELTKKSIEFLMQKWGEPPYGVDKTSLPPNQGPIPKTD